jgi:septum formation protein
MSVEKPDVILASTSRNRKALLNMLGVTYREIASNFDEESVVTEDPVMKVREIAFAKAKNVSTQYKGIIISGDTFTILNGKEYQKPKSKEEAKEMLREMGGKKGISITGICIINTETGLEYVTHREVAIECAVLSEEELEQYVNDKPVTDWAAAYNPLDELSSRVFYAVNGYSYGLEFGLPADVIAEELKKVGIDVDLSLLNQAR